MYTPAISKAPHLKLVVPTGNAENDNRVHDPDAVKTLTDVFGQVCALADAHHFYDTKDPSVDAAAQISFFQEAARSLREIVEAINGRDILLSAADTQDFYRAMCHMPNPNFADDGHIHDMCEKEGLSVAFYEESIATYARPFNQIADAIGWSPNLCPA